MNYKELSRACQRFALDCDGARLDNVVDGANTLCLSFTRYIALASTFAPRHVIFDFAPTHLDVYAVPRPPRAPQTPQAFTMLLRKHLVSQRVAAFRLSSSDRVVTLEFGPEASPRHALIFEFTGYQPNVFLIDVATNEILGSVWRDERRDVHQAYLPNAPKNFVIDSQDRFASIGDDAYFDAVGRFFAQRNHDEAFQLAHDALAKKLNKAATSLDKRVQALYRDLNKTDRGQKDRSEADLLSAYAYQLKPGADEAILPDFETGEDVVIKLDPALSIRENIEQRYNRCKRASRALPQIEARLAETHAQLDRVHAAQTALAALTDAVAIQQLDAELVVSLSDVFPKVKPPATAKKPVEAHKPYKTFTSKQGVNILVGKSAEDNDWLTFRVAKGNDWWLHVAHMPGSHVVIKSAEPDSDTLLDAATLAVHYSKLAQAKQAEVHATQQKFVHRIKGAPAGKVEIRGERVIAVVVEDERLKRLLKTES